MATVYKVLGQVNPSATTETSLYATPTGGSAAAAVVSTISICNQTGSSATYRIAIRKSGDASTTSKNWLVYGATVAASDTVLLTVGATLESGADLRVWSSIADMSFQAFGSEIN